jgi:hypothetical protein
MEIKEVVLTALKNSGEPLKGGQIADATGLDKKDVDKALKVLRADEAIYSPKRCFYSVKE